MRTRAFRKSNIRVESLESRRLLSAFTLDTGFANAGSISVEGARDVVVQGDGEILLTGGKTIFDHSGEFDHAEYDLTRLRADGSRDTTWGTNGTKDIGDVYLRRVGSRYLGFREIGASDVEVIVARQRNFRTDESFGRNGALAIPFQNPGDLRVDMVNGFSINLAPDNDLLVSYSSWFFDAQDDSDHVVKLNPDGSIDTSFGEGGYLNNPGDATFSFVSSHGIVLRSVTGNSREIRRYTLDGQPDLTFGGGDGAITLPKTIGDVWEQASGKLLYIDNRKVNGVVQPRLHRLNVDGSPDASFGDNGSVSLARAGATGRETQTHLNDDQGRIWVAASGTLFRFSVDGAPEGAPFNGTLDFQGALAAFDRSGGVLVLNTNKMARYQETQPVKLGADHVLRVTTDSADDSANVTLGDDGRIRVTVNGSTTAFHAKGISSAYIGDGNNSVTAGTDISITILTGSGNDTISAGSENDTILAGDGDDVISAGRGNDYIKAGAGDDRVSAGAGEDRVWGDAGDDDINGGVHDDRLSGGAGNDTVNGGIDTDFILGDEGDDLLIGNDGAHDHLVGGAGTDSARGDRDIDIFDPTTERLI